MPFALYAGTEPGVIEDARLFLDLGLEYYVQLDAVNELSLKKCIEPGTHVYLATYRLPTYTHHVSSKDQGIPLLTFSFTIYQLNLFHPPPNGIPAFVPIL